MPNIQWHGNHKCAHCTQAYQSMSEREKQGFPCPNCGTQNTPSLNVSKGIVNFVSIEKGKNWYCWRIHILFRKIVQLLNFVHFGFHLIHRSC